MFQLQNVNLKKYKTKKHEQTTRGLAACNNSIQR